MSADPHAPHEPPPASMATTRVTPAASPLDAALAWLEWMCDWNAALVQDARRCALGCGAARARSSRPRREE